MTTGSERRPQKLEEDFHQAMKAFDLFTMSERLHVLHVFAGLRYPCIESRFFEAVFKTIHKTLTGFDPREER
jgi:hypothetical protein